MLIVKECLEPKWSWIDGPTSHIQLYFCLLVFSVSLSHKCKIPAPVTSVRSSQNRTVQTTPRTFRCLFTLKVSYDGNQFTSLVPEPSSFRPLGESWAQEQSCGSCLQHLFKVGGGRERRKSRASSSLQLQLTRASCRHRRLTRFQSVATLKPYVWVQSYCDTFLVGWEGEAVRGAGDARWFLNHFWRLSLREGKQNTNQESFLLATSAAGNSRCRCCGPAHGQACIPILFSSGFFSYLNLL